MYRIDGDFVGHDSGAMNDAIESGIEIQGIYDGTQMGSALRQMEKGGAASQAKAQLFKDVTKNFSAKKFLSFPVLLTSSTCETGKETEPSYEDLHSLPAAIYLAQEVGAGLGTSEILQRGMPERQTPGQLRKAFENRQEFHQYLREQFPEQAGVSDGLSSIQGGEQMARKALEEFRARRYAATRNFLSGSVSRLSAYIRHGVLTLREISDKVTERAGGLGPVYKFVQELAWRDYWQRLYFELGRGVWVDREEWKTGFTASDYAGEMPDDIVGGSTQLACMDAFSTTLVQEGYLHNHARMWFAAYLVHWRQVKWQAGAKWFLTHLIDGDPASNNLSWQWVASTFSNKPYIFNRENLERYTNGVYCEKCRSRDACPFDRTYEVLSAELFPRGQR